MKLHECCICGATLIRKSESSARKGGRFIRHSCYREFDNAKYRQHWSVKSLQYQKPSVPSTRPRKPLPGQQKLSLGRISHDITYTSI